MLERPRSYVPEAVLVTALVLAVALVATPGNAQSFDPSHGVSAVSVRVTAPGGQVYGRYDDDRYAFAPVRVNLAPPPNLIEVPPAAQSAGGSVWIPGSWNWNGAGYAWTAGHWNAPPAYGTAWIAPRWERRGGYVLYYPGYWGGASVIEPSYVPTTTGTSAITTLLLGSTASSELRFGMPTTSSGALYADFAVSLYAGHPVTFVLHGGASWTSGGRIDPVMQVFGAGQLLAEDDDSAGNLDSRIQFTPAWTGTYIVRATTFGAGMNQGTFSLVTRDGSVWDGI